MTIPITSDITCHINAHIVCCCMHVQYSVHATCTCTVQLNATIFTLSRSSPHSIIIQTICSVHISTLLGAQGANPETLGQATFSFTIHVSVLGSFTCITQHTGPTALRPIRRTKQLWQLSVLLKDTSAATGQARIRTHILTTPELESNALDRSATALHKRRI